MNEFRPKFLSERCRYCTEFHGSADEDICLAISELEALKAENERLQNRVNLLSVSANTVRDAYDNGLNAELQSKITSLEKSLERAKEALTDIQLHSTAPFVHVDPRNNNWKWLNYVNDVAKEALNSVGK